MVNCTVYELYLKAVLKRKSYDEVLPSPLNMCRTLLGSYLYRHYIIEAMAGQFNAVGSFLYTQRQQRSLTFLSSLLKV